MRRRFPYLALWLGLAIAIGGAAGYLLERFKSHGGNIVVVHDSWEVSLFERRLNFRLARDADTVAHFRHFALWRNQYPHPVGYVSVSPSRYAEQRAFQLDRGKWGSDTGGLTGTYWSVGVPYWSVSVVGALLAARGGWVLWRRRRAVATGLCPVCRYDLRASPERCPECGTPVQPRPIEEVR